jgi:hypothetical protein
MDEDRKPGSKSFRAVRRLASLFVRSPSVRAASAPVASTAGASLRATGGSAVNASVHLGGSLNPAEREAARGLMASFIASTIGGNVIANAIDIGTTIQTILNMADKGE